MEFSSSENSLFSFRVRVIVAALFVFFCFGLVLARYLYLQVYRHDYYATRADNNRISIVPIAPNRGLILDRNGVVLARNYSAYTLEITPGQIGSGKTEDLNVLINELSKIVPIELKDRRRFFRLVGDSKKYESLPVRSRLTDEEVARFVAQRYRFPGVDVKARLFRQYPQGEFAAHAIGYIGRISTRDIEAMGDDQEMLSNYQGSDYIGKSGLEQFYEKELHGTTGSEQLEVDKSGHAVRVLARNNPVSGNNLILTLDSGLQRVVEQAFKNRRGSFVAIEPKTGDVLALVSMPGYDPNLFVDGIGVQDWNSLNNSPDHPLLNRAINSAYPPGSTFKPFMALAALETHKRTAAQGISDPGYFDFGNNRFRDDKVGGHGFVNMHTSIVASCDTYYYTLANDMGIDLIASFMGKLGFGSKTGIDLPKESIGVLPSPEWKQKRFKKPEQQKWYSGETISIGIGQGYNTYTPIQLANATAVLASGGLEFKPHLVKFIEESKTAQKRMVEPTPARVLPFKPENIEVIRKAMVDVTKFGTSARVFAGAGYESAGKTGTAQVFSLRGAQYNKGALKANLHDHALYIAFAPANDPKIAIAILVENGGFGAESAAPIARQALDYYLLGKKPAGFIEPKTNAQADAAGAAQ